MGLYNRLAVYRKCPNCSHIFEDQIQYKYGFTRQLEYKLEDRISWSGTSNDEGDPKIQTVKVLGIFEEEHCPSCRIRLDEDIQIIIHKDILKSCIELSTDDWVHYFKHNETYIEFDL